MILLSRLSGLLKHVITSLVLNSHLVLIPVYMF